MADYQVFISYRRDGGEHLAGRLSDRLKNMGYHVFYDIESMRSGTFNTQIYAAIEQCRDVLLILPPNGLDRCKNADDWVRIEIVHALQHQKNIIPIMMRGFTYPKDLTELPEELRVIPDLESVEDSSSYFDGMIQRILELMDCPDPAGGANKAVGEALSNGVRFMNYRQYDKADAAFAEAMRTEPAGPDAYFYAAAALLRGKRPFLSTKPVIDQILEHLTTAAAIEDKAVYRCLLAYIKYDFHHRKMLRVAPDWAEELAQAVRLGLTEPEKQELFDLLGVQAPEVF